MMTRLPVVTDYGVCKPCGGSCCKNLPGEVWPADVWGDGEPDWKKIEEMLASGNYAVDWWEGDEPGYYLRPAIVGHPGPFDPARAGEPCVFFTEGEGCSLEENTRPTGCRVLVPSATDRCKPSHGGGGKESAKDAWEPWADKLETVAARVEGNRR